MTLPYDVFRAFEATEPISGRRRRFDPGEVVTCDTAPTGPKVTIEADTILFIVDRLIFKTCCKFRSAGGAAF
jgi:hypothetical protein